jgi:hypothetical protein
MDYVEKLFINMNKLKYSLKYINIDCENLIYSLFKSMQTDYRYNCIDYLYHHKKERRKTIYSCEQIKKSMIDELLL